MAAPASINYYELYRESSVGWALVDALDEQIQLGQIPPQVAVRVCANFDQVMTEALQKYVKARMSFKGSLDTYRFCDEVWTFQLRKTLFKLDGGHQVSADKVKIVSCNAKKPGDF